MTTIGEEPLSDRQAPLTVTFLHCVDQNTAATQMFGIHFMPVWAYTLAAHLAEIPGLRLGLFDNRMMSENDIEQADLFLLTGINQDFSAIVDLHARLKKVYPHSLFAVGGPVCWSFETAGKLSLLDPFDAVFIGDAEETLPAFVRDLVRGKTTGRLIRPDRKFPLSDARPMHRPFLDETAGRYYGAVLEVSRGCPFLCEFCDIRVLPDNNRTHVKSPDLIVSELDHFHDLGIRQVLLACDNFIGLPSWAEEAADRIIAWRVRTGKALSLYTWLTVNLAGHPRLLTKLRRAGFDMFFIGVESFNSNSLLETAKIQNAKVDLPATIREIQSYGFIVVAGLIFGFDTDTEDVFDLTLRGILESGLISGDPSLLTALPGTPLYKRMLLSGRLRKAKLGLGGYKYQTNIRYLQPADRIKDGFLHFIKAFNEGAYQVRRLERFYDALEIGEAGKAGRFVPSETRGYADLGRLLTLTSKNLPALRSLFHRLGLLLFHRDRLKHVLKGLILTWRRSQKGRGLWFYFKFWLFNWSNSLVKYSHVGKGDFDIESVREDFRLEKVIPAEYGVSLEETVPPSKGRRQRRLTIEALSGFLRESRSQGEETSQKF